jgi:hypothetical protein
MGRYKVTARFNFGSGVEYAFECDDLEEVWDIVKRAGIPCLEWDEFKRALTPVPTVLQMRITSEAACDAEN